MKYHYKDFQFYKKLNNMDDDELIGYYNHLKSCKKSHYSRINLLKLIQYLNDNNIIK